MKRIIAPLLISALLVFLPRLGLTLDPPHDSTNTIDCSKCHTPHKAVGGAITTETGNANLCYSCHTDGGLATSFPMDEGDQALPAPGLPSGVSPTGFSHRWDSGPAGHVKADATNISTGTVQSGGAFTGRYAKTYTITITAAGDAGTAIFSWTDTRGGGGSGFTTGSGVPLDEGVNATFTNGAGSPISFLLNDRWYIYVRTDINLPTNIDMLNRMPDGKIMCSTCHNQHSEAAEPFDPSAPAYGGSGTGTGRHFQRIDNDTNQMCRDCHSARDVTLSSSGSHPVGVTIPGTGLFKSPTTLPLDKTTGTVQCMTCHQPHYAPTNDGTLLRMTDVTSLCTDCHTIADTINGSHFNTSTGVLWPGGQYGSNFPAITDTSKRGACINCHSPHGWPDDAAPTQDYAKLLVERGSGDICFTCHDSDGPASVNIYTLFNGATNYQTTALDGALVNQRHDVTAADQAYSGGVVACANCHNPHRVTNTAKLMDPDSPTVAYTQTYAKTNSYTRSGYNFSYQSASTDLDPMNPIGCTAQPASIGPAVAGANSGDDTASSGGTYTGSLDQTYTVTVSTGGTPGVAQITTTSTGADSSGPTTVTAFGTPVAVGTLGVTVTFTEPSVPGSVGTATCTTNCLDDTATSGGTYNGPSNGTYTLAVTTSGTSGAAQLTCTTAIAGDACNPSTTYTWSNGTAIPIGSYGVTIAITDPDNSPNNRTLEVGEQWQIPVTAGGSTGDGILTSGDTWTIAATAATAGCSTAPEPDMVTFCLVCHDNAPPAGVTMSPNLVNIASAYNSSDQHGRIAGNNGANGYMKAPWQDVVANGDGTWANSELPNPYAALQCTTCHDGHGTDNIFHLKTSITVRGQQMAVGGGPGSGFESNPFTAASDYGPGASTYKLPCFIGSTQVSCSQAGSAQQDHKWGAFCTFCHDMQTHGQSEDNTCRTGHRHGGGAF